MRLQVDLSGVDVDVEKLSGVIHVFDPGARITLIKDPENVLPPVVKVSREEARLAEMAKRIAKVIHDAPPTASWRSSYLSALLSGGDSWMMSGGDKNWSPRADAIAFSKYLKKTLPDVFSPNDRPTHDLAHHKVLKFEDGQYKGVQYSPTALGKAVREILKQKQA